MVGGGVWYSRHEKGRRKAHTDLQIESAFHFIDVRVHVAVNRQPFAHKSLISWTNISSDPITQLRSYTGITCNITAKVRSKSEGDSASSQMIRSRIFV